MPPPANPPAWTCLSEHQQVDVAHAALAFAVRTIADQADLLAGEIDQGTLQDLGGADALRLLASVLRLSGRTGAALPVPAPDLAQLEVAGRA
jgi:hypothetical protein